MFYEWVYPLHHHHGLSVLNVFRYITFRSAYAAITALLLCYWLGPPDDRVAEARQARAEDSRGRAAGAPTSKPARPPWAAC